MKSLLLFLFSISLAVAQDDPISALQKKWGPEVNDCLEALPALESSFAAGAESGPAAARAYSAKLAEADRATFLKRVEATLVYRRLLEELTDDTTGRFHGVALKVPALAGSYRASAKIVGVSLDGQSPADLASGLSTGQDSYLLTRLALQLANLDEQARLKALAEILIEIRKQKS